MASRSAKESRNSTNSSTLSTRSAKYSRVNEEDLKNFLDSFQSRVNYLSRERDGFLSSINDYYTNRDDSVYGLDTSNKWRNSIASRTDWLQRETTELESILDEYGGYFDSDTVSSLRKAFYDIKATNSKILEQADVDVDYWSQFKDENEYYDYYFGNKYDGKTYDEIREAIKSASGHEKDWLNTNSYNFKSSAELQEEIDAISKEHGLDEPMLAQVLKYGGGDLFDLFGGGVNSNREWAKNRVSELTELQGQAKLRESHKALVNEAKNDTQYSLYVNKGKADGTDKLIAYRNDPQKAHKESAQAMRAGASDFNSDAWSFAQHMKEDEYNNYLYFLGKYGKDKANEYLDTIESTINSREAVQYKEQYENSIILDDLFNVYANLDRWGDSIASIFSDGYKAPSSIQIANQMLGSEKEGLEKVVWDTVGNISYQVPNILGGIAASYFLGPSGLGVMGATTAGTVGQLGLTGLSSYGSARQEMLNLGYSNGQASMYGAITAASEVGLQYALGSIGKVSGVWTDDAVKSLTAGLNSAGAKFAIEFGAGMLSEGIEEALQEVLDPFFKKLVTGKNEDLDWGQVAYAGMLGALSAGVMNGTGEVSNRISNLNTARQIKKDNKVDALKEIGNTFSADTLAYKLASKVNDKTSTWQLATLIKEMNGTLSDQNVADIKYQLVRNGVMESDADTISKWLAKAVDGEHFTAAQRKALDGNPIIQRVFKKVIIDQNSTVNQRLNALMEVYGQKGHAGIDYSAIAKAQSKESLSNAANVRQTFEAMKTDAIKQKYGIGRNGIGNESYNAMLDGMVADAKNTLMPKGNVSETGKTTDSTGRQIDIKKVKDAKTKMFELTDGSTISSKNVEYSDDDTAILYETVLSRGYDTDTANAVINGLKAANGLSVTQYLNGVDEAIEYGKIGYPMDKISSSGFYADLSSSMKKFAYNLGKDMAKKETDSAQAKVDGAKGNVEEARKGEVIISTKKGLTERQAASLETLGKMVADITHNKVYIFESVEKTINGKKVRVFAEDTAGFKASTIADNGFYNRATGEIYIDLHAGMNGEGVILWTAAHELTHFIRQWSPTKFKVLADFLMAEYGKQGVDIQTLIDNKIANSYRKKLTREQAYEEVVADAMQTMFTDTDLASKVEKLKNTDKSLWKKIKQFLSDLYKRITEAYKGVDPQTDEAKLVRQMGDSIKKLSDLFAEAIVDAGNTYAYADIDAVASGEVDIDGNTNAHTFSIRSMVEGAGLSFEYDTKTGQIKILDMLSGKEVTSITKDQIKSAPLGNIVSLAKQNGFISESEADKQYGFLADLVNLCLNYKENFTMVWEIAGTQVFSAIKANSDTQYGKTVDFSTVCKKTQQVINVISETQKRLKRGLTKDEIKNIVYYETGKAGEPTPCPVCYVFSRWMGIGGILQQMSDFQKKYDGATEEDMRNFINDVESEIIKHANTPNKSGKLKAEFFDKNGKPKFGSVIADLKSKANSKIKSANIRLKIQETETLLEKADVKDKAKLQKTLNRLKNKLAKEGDILDAKLKDAEALMSRYEEYQWLTKTYMDEVKAEDGTHLGWKLDKNFKPVDEDVLWDLREGARFATEFPKSWLYRTTKGCNAGKAILPYSDARVGETIQGVAYANVKDIMVGENNAFLNGDTKAQADYVTRAIKKQLAQNLIGGMRYQSTSDFRYEYGSDYLITFLEMQAIGAKVQLYTKVIEAVDFLCTMGAEVNLSVMPLNKGYIEHTDGRKQLVFSSVTGINAEAAIAKTKQYDNAQLILVGISDEHIRLALEGDDVNGDIVTFVIPFHGSGNTVKAIQELMNLIGEDLNVTEAQDYSLVQTDHFAKNRTAEQTALWELRKKIISRSYKKNGNTVSWDGKLTSAEEALLNSKNGRKYLKDLYNRFYVDKSADEYGVSLSTAQAEQIFPYEYWDKSLTYAEADRNGERFKEYCATMGIIPRFSGVDSSGKALGYGDFANTKGYWKLLIDRKMYNNDGTYHSPGKINVSDFKAETLNPAWGSATYGDVMQKDTNPKKTNAITENVVRQIEGKAADNLVFSERSPYDGKKLYENKEVYAYSFMVSLDNMEVKSLPSLSSVKDNGRISQAKVVSLGLENAKSIGKEITPTQYAIKNAYTKRDIILGTNGLNHSLDASNISRLRTNARLSAIGGYIVQNAIPVNGLKKENKQANGTYAMACLLKDGDGYVVAIVTVDEFSSQAIDFDFVEITHSINGRFIAKKEDSRSSTRELELGQESLSTTTASTISIADFLEIVNSTHRSILSDDVLNHFDESRPEGHYTDRVLFSERNPNATDNRTLLANALESVAKNDVERSWLTKYKSQIESLNADQDELTRIRKEIHQARFGKGGNRGQLTKLENQAKILADRITKADKKLLMLEASKPLQGVVERERAKAYQLGKEKLAEYRQERAESAALHYYRPRIEKIVGDMSKRLENPSAKNAIPEAFGASVARVLSAFNFTTYDKDGNARVSKANMSRAEAREALANLADQLAQNTIEATYGQLDIPPEMLDWIKEMATYFEAASSLASEEFTINKMNEVQLKNIYKFLRSLQTAINKAGKYYTNASYDVASDAKSTMEYVGKLPTEVNEKLQKATKMLKWDFASPVTVFDRFGEGGKHVYNMLVKGQSKMAYNAQDVLDFVEKAYTEKEAKEWRETLVPVEIGGTKYNVTVDMLMGLHCLLKQEDSKRHILEGGGIRFADVKNKGKVKRFENIFFNEVDANAVEKALDAFPRARDVAEAMQKFMEEKGSSWGNEISMIRFGYHAFTTKGYYPIRTIAAGSEYEAQQKRANIYALLNKSFTKERTPGANNAVVVDGIFSVFNDHMAEMALYNAWALPVIDTIKWFNYKETQDIDAKTAEKSVHETFRLAYGNYADEYVRRLLESINSQTDNGLSEEWAFINLRTVNRVAVAWNIRVAIQQPFSVTRAFELINPKYVTPLIGKAYKEANAEMLAHSGIAKWKSLGYYDVDVSRPMETQVMKNATAADKFTEIGMKGAELGDSLTWTSLWNACKKETKEKNPNLEGEALLEKTAERFNDIALRTQVVDSVLAKPQWMRSKGFWHKSTSAFMSEPLTSYNALLRQHDTYARDVATHGIKYATKNNFKGIVKATGIFLLTQLVNALATAPLDAMRDDDDYETYIEKFLANFKENAAMNLLPTSMLPWVSDIVEYFVYGRTDRADMALLVNGIDLGKSIWNLFDPDKYSYQKLHNTFNSMLKVGSQLSGFAVSNIWRDAISIYNTVAGNLGYGELKFQTSADSSSTGYEKMYDALFNGNKDRAELLYGQLLSNGVEEDNIYNGLTKYVKEAFANGEITEEEAIERIMAIIDFTGKTEADGSQISKDDIFWQVDKWKYTNENDGNSEGYSKYDDIFTAMESGDPTSAIEWHIEKKVEAYLEEARIKAENEGTTFNEKKAKKEAESKAESSIKSAITSYWKPKYKEAYDNNDTEEMKRIRYALKATKLYGTTSDLLSTVKNWVKD